MARASNNPITWVCLTPFLFDASRRDCYEICIVTDDGTETDLAQLIYDLKNANR